MRENNVVELKEASIYHIRGTARKYSNERRRLKLLRNSEMVLCDVNLSVGRGEFVYLIGRVGTGKSTLLKTIYGEIPLAQGKGRVAGYDLRTLRRKEIPHLRRRIGIVFQDYKLLTDRNVFDNLHYSMRATGWRNETDMRRKIEEVLQTVDLFHKLYKMPYQLSGGQQQRLAIARALINNPEVLLADEPTGNLDPSAAAGVMELFQKIVHDTGCSIIMSTHNIGLLAEYPSRTIRLLQSRVEEIDAKSILGV